MLHADPHAPVAVSQIGPGCVPVVQSLLPVHFPHAPPATQNGFAAVGQAALAPEPVSPLHATHVFVAVLQTGVGPVQAPVLSKVHATHWFVAVLQAGVGPPHCPSAMHGSQSPLFVPVVTQTPALHCAFEAHVPSPWLMPQTFAVVSQAPLAQTMAPNAGLQVPPIGGECPATVGIGDPLGSCGVQVFVPVLQKFPAAQSPSFAQPSPPAGTQSPEETPHVALLQTTDALPALQGPSPMANPHFKSEPQTPLRQTPVGSPMAQVPSPFAKPHALSVSHALLVHCAFAPPLQTPLL
jgi:hypothetical protein